ncbi:MAG: hypothetical protein NT077_02085 [Candidatus Taylorbacteria bacterium]|nr:hypothetical protein [Candidatus Taylorbacteria bacterium]
MPTKEFVTRVEFDEKMKIIDQKFDDFTETMLSQFDRMYVYMNNKFDTIDRRFNALELRFNRLDYNINTVGDNVLLIARHLNLMGRKLGINDEILIKES